MIMSTLETSLSLLKSKGYEARGCVTQTTQHDICAYCEGRTVFSNTNAATVTLTAAKDGKIGEVSGSAGNAEKMTALTNQLMTAVDESAIILDGYSPCTVENNHIHNSYEPMNVNRQKELLYSFLADVEKKNPAIRIRQSSLSYLERNTAFLDTKGNEAESLLSHYQFSSSYAALHAQRNTSFQSSSFRTDAIEKPLIECGSIASDLFYTERLLENECTCDGNIGHIILAPKALWLLLFLFFRNQMGDGGSIPLQNGTQLMDPLFSAYTGPVEKINFGEAVFTGRGTKAEKQYLIDCGMVTGHLFSDLYAYRMKTQPRKNDSVNFSVEPGQMEMKEMLKNAGTGLLIGRYSGGAPSPNGDFSGLAKNSFFIRDGMIVGPCKGVSIHGNIFDVLKDIQGLSSETENDGFSMVPYLMSDQIKIN